MPASQRPLKPAAASELARGNFEAPLPGATGDEVGQLTTAFGEMRSAAACNGLVGPVQGRDCYALGDDRWYSARSWRAAEPILLDRTAGDGWHFVEVYVRLNSTANGRSVPDGLIRYWVDGWPTLAVDSILFRTAANGEARINQLILAPYIGDGSPVAQAMWISDVTVARGVSPRD